jgi:hypothetical protein
MALAESEAEGIVKDKTINNAETLSLVAYSIAFMRAYPERDCGHQSGIRRRSLSEIPDYLLTKLWNCFRHRDGYHYQQKYLKPNYKNKEAEEQKDRVLFDRSAGNEVVRPHVKPPGKDDWNGCLAATKLDNWQPWIRKRI